jgi:hypothetical protein
MLRALVARLLIVTVSSTIVPRAEGAMIGTEAAIRTDREHILMLLNHPDVASQLEAYGVKPSDAKARIAALSDAELAMLSAEMDRAYAGAGGGGGLFAALATVTMIALVVLLLPVFLVGGLIALGVKAGKSPNGSGSAESSLTEPRG